MKVVESKRGKYIKVVTEDDDLVSGESLLYFPYIDSLSMRTIEYIVPETRFWRRDGGIKLSYNQLRDIRQKCYELIAAWLENMESMESEDDV